MLRGPFHIAAYLAIGVCSGLIVLGARGPWGSGFFVLAALILLMG